MERKRPGRRTARAPEPVRVPISFRVTPAFKAELDRTAAQSGRSLAQEVELRLDRSLEAQHWLRETLEFAFGRQAAALMLAIGCAVKGTAELAMMLERPRPASWLSNAFAFGQVTIGINRLLQLIKPDGNASELPPGLARFLDSDADTKEKAMLEHFVRLAGGWGETVAEDIAAAPEPDGENVDVVVVDIVLGPWGPVIRDWLGDAAVAHLRDRLRNSSPDRDPSPKSELERGSSVIDKNPDNPGRVRRKRSKPEPPK